MNKKVFLPLIILAIIAILAGGGILWWSMMASTSPSEVSLTPTPTLTETPGEEPEEEEEMETKSDLEQIIEAFAEKYSKPIGDVDVNISENTGTYATGGVRFAGEMGGAMWLAYNDGEEWIIVHDGHGTIPCSSVDPYSFPADMVPECWDEDAGELINRS